MLSPAGAKSRELVDHVKATFGDFYDSLRFPSPETAESAQRERASTIERLSAGTESLCGGTKLVSGSLPKGCALCVEGAWSCLLINEVCDAGCFFCPKTKDHDATPTSDGLSFPNVAEFVAYLGTMGFRGVGISGGEPLLSLPRTLDFIGGIKAEFRDSVHVWLYSSGLHASEDALRKLRAAGLDEIRFNIAAQGFAPDAVRRATSVFDSVVVEVPMVPEKAEALTSLLPALSELGVQCLNLHQMWCSTTNGAALANRGYTFLHGSRVSVLESEQAALRLLESAVSSDLGMPVHYCSSVFKERYQTAAALRRDACLMARDYEEVTEAGLIRALSVAGSKPELVEQCRRFDAAGATSRDFFLDQEGPRLFFKARLWDAVDLDAFTPRLTYDLAYRPPAGERSDSVVEVPFSTGRRLRLKRAPVGIVPAMSEAERHWFRERIVRKAGDSGRPGDPTRMESFETIQAGLPPYT